VKQHILSTGRGVFGEESVVLRNTGGGRRRDGEWQLWNGSAGLSQREKAVRRSNQDERAEKSEARERGEAGREESQRQERKRREKAAGMDGQSVGRSGPLGQSNSTQLTAAVEASQAQEEEIIE
jgi:hypothetical protein